MSEMQFLALFEMLMGILATLQGHHIFGALMGALGSIAALVVLWKFQRGGR